jgi:hypothetical protein
MKSGLKRLSMKHIGLKTNQVTLMNQFKLNKKIETITKTNQTPKKKITKKHKVKKSETHMFHSFKKTGVSKNETELSKHLEKAKLSESQGLRLNSRHSAKMSSTESET